MTLFTIKNGQRLAVIRPADAALACKLAQQALDEKWSKNKFDEILQKQEYTYQGFLAAAPDGKPFIADPKTGEKLGDLVSGDSFIPENELLEAGTTS